MPFAPNPWANARPHHVFEAPYLRIDYSSLNDDARGFISDETNAGAPRRFLYEAQFRNMRWDVKLSAADPNNNNSFVDRDGPSKPIRTLIGLPKGSRKDLVTDLRLKLSKFRSNILAEEDKLRGYAAQGLHIKGVPGYACYFLYEKTLIRIQHTIIREFVLAIELPDASVDAALKAIG